MLEHVVSERLVSAALMRAFDPVWLWLNDQGCHMDRDTHETVRAAFGDVGVERFQVFSAGLPAFPMCELRGRKA